LIIVVSSGCIAAFISMKWLSLSLLSNLRLTYPLSDISIATPACFLCPLVVNFLPAFHPKPVFVSVNKVGLL
jgi:hypothetical protein